jgi:hypothetical protein
MAQQAGAGHHDCNDKDHGQRSCPGGDLLGANGKVGVRSVGPHRFHSQEQEHPDTRSHNGSVAPEYDRVHDEVQHPGKSRQS